MDFIKAKVCVVESDGNMCGRVYDSKTCPKCGSKKEDYVSILGLMYLALNQPRRDEEPCCLPN